MGTVKAVPEYRRKKNKAQPVTQNSDTEDVNHTQVIELTREKTPPLIVAESSFMKERAGTLSSQPPGTPPVRGRLKIKKTGDWRKEILGEMTVMNAEELRELNNIMRAELRTPDRGRSRTKKLSTLGLESGDTRGSVFPEEVEFPGARPNSARSCERPYSSRYNIRPSSPIPCHNSVRPYNGQKSRDIQDNSPRVPDLFVAPGTPTNMQQPSEQRKQSKSDIKKLKVKKPPTAPNAKLKENMKDKKKGNGEMPDWMVKFVNDKKLTIGDDVKLDETKQHKGKRSSSTSGVSTRTGTGTSKSSTLKTGTATLKARSTGNIPNEVESRRTSKSSPNVRAKPGQTLVTNNR